MGVPRVTVTGFPNHKQVAVQLLSELEENVTVMAVLKDPPPGTVTGAPLLTVPCGDQAVPPFKLVDMKGSNTVTAFVSVKVALAPVVQASSVYPMK